MRPPQPNRSRVMVINMIDELDNNDAVIIPIESEIPDMVQGLE